MSILFPLLGVLYIVLGIPLWRRIVPPNGLYGFRTKLTLSSAEVWYEVNERSGKLLLIFGCLLFASAVLYLWLFFGDKASGEKHEWLLIATFFFLMLMHMAIDFVGYYAKYRKCPKDMPTSDSEPQP